jgi:hypothetical protein
MIDEKAVGLRLLAEREGLLDALYQNRAMLAAFGIVVEMDELEREYEAQRREHERVGPGRPPGTDLPTIYAAMRDHLLETREMPRKRDIAQRIERSEDTIDLLLHKAGTTFRDSLASLASVIHAAPRPDKRHRIRHR